ncbi:glycosyltransferase family 52 [Cetobacterium sp. SF1]|uniref:glycosyltransferase family 52 n=1 Tax=Cetobacterium sp. SF1 TaxID=3417654 RepID=UPI003CEB6D6A
MKRVFLGNTMYSLMIYLILFPREIDETYYVFGGALEGRVKNLKSSTIEEKTSKIRILRKFYRIYSNFQAKRFFKKNKLDKLPVYGIDHWSWNGYIKKYHDIFLIEDGTINYDLKNQIESFKKRNWRKRVRWWLYWKKPSFGLSEGVKKIYLTGLGPIPGEIKDKVEIIDLEKKWNLLTGEEKNKIFKIFGIEDSIVEKIKRGEGVLITQPLSEDKVLTEEEKIELYRKILNNYKNIKIIIKKHPREETDYSKYFPEAIVINEEFPFELLLLNGEKVKKLITIFSTGVLMGKDKLDIDFYGTEIDEKIYKRFGSMEHIQKKNCKVERS